MAKAGLGNAYEALSGRIGNNVASNEQDGTGLRSHNPISHQPFTPRQLASEAAFAKANQTWTVLPAATASEWATYARPQKVRNPLTGKYRTRQAKNVFSGLYSALLNLSPSHALPQIPTGPFAGDVVTINPLTEDGELVFEASGANRAGVTTILMGQRLPSANATPSKDGYRILGYKTFTAQDARAEFQTGPGFWSVAFSFLDTVTGQESATVALPMVAIALAVVKGGANEDSAEGKKAA